MTDASTDWKDPDPGLSFHTLLEECREIDGNASTINLKDLPESLRMSWQAALGPEEPHKLERRLQWDRLATERIAAQIQSCESPSTCHPLWTERLKRLQKSLQQCWDQPLLEGDQLHQLAFPFVDLWHPAALLIMSDLRQQVSSTLPQLILQDSAWADLERNLIARLSFLGEQLLWKPFMEGRRSGTMLLAQLGPDGSGQHGPVREYYQSFIQDLRQDGLKSLLQQHPVFGKLLADLLERWPTNILEMLNRLQGDRPDLANRFGISIGAPLSRLRAGLSDPHRGGRGVIRLSFGDETSEQHLIYKPKDLRLDATWQEALADLNQHSKLPPLRTLQLLCRENYGWMEAVQHRLCRTPDELNRFYHNAGRITAMLHLLGCTDCHEENLIAEGDQLLLIDTETLFEPELPNHIAEARSEPQIERGSLRHRIADSVLRTGVLPRWIFTGDGAQDISALGATPPITAEHMVPGWVELNSDGMMPGQLMRPATLPTSLPVGIGERNPFTRHLDVFTQGFTDQWHVVIECRKRWLQNDGILQRFTGLPRRIVLRATAVYATILRQQLQADALRSPIQQAMKQEQLARSFLLADQVPQHWPIFAAEVRQLEQLDVPYFEHRIDSCDLILDQQGSELQGFIRTSGLNAARIRLKQMEEQELEFQLKLIRGACEARFLGEQTPEFSESQLITAGDTSKSLSDQSPSLTQEAAVERLIEQLKNSAITDPDGSSEWLGMNIGEDGEGFTFGPVGSELYGGSIGIGCLLRAWRGDGQENSFERAVLKPLQTLCDQNRRDGRLRWWRDQAKGLMGCGGMLLALQLMGEQGQSNATRILDGLMSEARADYLRRDRQFDLIGGVAGLIGPLLAIQSDQSLGLASVCGERLLEAQDPDGSWRDIPMRPGMLGFSHGTAGIAASLTRLHAHNGDTRLLDAACRALGYERRHFVPDQGNWLDLRRDQTDQTGQPKQVCTSTWCHGAPGIALGRACLWGTPLWDEDCENELHTAIRNTAQSQLTHADHLCCGSLGLIAIMRMLLSGPWPIPTALSEHCQQSIKAIETDVLNRVGQDPPDLICLGTPEGNLTLPGFFNGLSGMGMALLGNERSERMLNSLLTAGLWPN
ncbi:type II lanthionine synthetase [Synechococcus sp. BIOS-E4-1]|uniref:type 2 lanthipeptide synthetase LanM family protein n=1 Tax=Synechococcus sp. BIOS-E4-1 TaxID=1400864 RepID=UPI0016490630|nr:type 2 lanthipeptide synthetase LanM family protein [Synechococcus sp. BIOS-E4-1]QNI53062.1 type II lanthionine synthetase [Synechococcus sp. BIOS-E4-1]